MNLTYWEIRQCLEGLRGFLDGFLHSDEHLFWDGLRIISIITNLWALLLEEDVAVPRRNKYSRKPAPVHNFSICILNGQFTVDIRLVTVHAFNRGFWGVDGRSRCFRSHSAVRLFFYTCHRLTLRCWNFDITDPLFYQE